MKAALLRLALGLACLAPASAALTDSLLWRQLTIEGHHVKWQRSPGQRLVLTWRLLSHDESYDDAVNCRRMGTPASIVSSSKLDQDAVRVEANQAFELWLAAADIVFIEAATGAKADISIGAQLDPIGRAFTDVQFDRSAAPASDGAITRSLICLNPSVSWKTALDGNLDIYDLRITPAHEIGHAIGLDHPDGPGSLMWFRYAERSRELQRGDVQGAVALYGLPRPAQQVAGH